jgi:ureidoglycolate hydrolase
VKTITLPLERMTHEAFEPFGSIIEAPQPSPPDLDGDLTRGWEVPFEADGPVQVLALYTQHGGSRFSKLERHSHVTQTFIAVSGSVSAVAVAPGSPDRPDPEAIRAFLVEPPRAYVLGRGVWHSLDRFPLQAPGATFVMVTELETTTELRKPPELWERTAVYDYSVDGLVFGLAFPEVTPALRPG